jgi:hypothetical protein
MRPPLVASRSSSSATQKPELPPPWHITHGACRRLVAGLSWQPEPGVDLIARARQLLLEHSRGAAFVARDGQQRERWVSTMGALVGLCWVVAHRNAFGRAHHTVAHLIWVGFGPPPVEVWHVF